MKMTLAKPSKQIQINEWLPFIHRGKADPCNHQEFSNDPPDLDTDDIFGAVTKQPGAEES